MEAQLDALAAEFDMLTARAGLHVPQALRESLLPGYAALRDQVELLRGHLTEAAEPSNVFRLAPLGQG